MPTAIAKEIQCGQCKKSFVPRRSWQKYCSPSCRTDHFWATHEIVEKKVEPEVKTEKIAR